MADGFGDLVEGLLDVGRDGEHVAQVRDRDRLPEVHAQLEAVRAVQRRDLAKFVADLLFTGLLDSSDLATMFLTEVGSSLAQEDKTPEMNRITYRDCPPEFWMVSNHNNWKLFISHRISLL